MKQLSILRSFAWLTLCTLSLAGCSTNGSGPSFSSSSSGSGHTTYSGKGQHPKQIALLLPLSGRNANSAKAIQDGFFASYHAVNGRGADQNAVKVYDTSGKNVQMAYTVAVREGADFVVGPLAKEEVQQINRMPAAELNVPVLALNNISKAEHSPNFMQFSLAPEYEAELIADKARQQGYQTASIIVPDNPWGQRVAAGFTRRWESQGGQIFKTVYAHTVKDQSGAVREALGIEQTPEQADKAKQAGQQAVRPNSKIDVIIMAAAPSHARQIKPLLNFYYADHLPVYATSSIYQGTPNAAADRDLNGVIFCDMPSLLDPQRRSALDKMMSSNSAYKSDEYIRLFAMGADAYQLTGRRSFAGETGDLTLGPDNVVHRQLLWAKMQNGVPQRI